MIEIKIHYTELSPSTYEGFRIPTTDSGMYLDIFREDNHTAKVVDCNRLLVTSPHGYVREYAVSFELNGADHRKMWERSTGANLRFWKAVEAVVMARLYNTVRYINRHQW